MSYMTPEGGAMLYHDLSDRAFLSVTPVTFVRKILERNPQMTCNMLTIENMKFIFVRRFPNCRMHDDFSNPKNLHQMGMLTSKCLHKSPMPDVRA